MDALQVMLDSVEEASRNTRVASDKIAIVAAALIQFRGMEMVVSEIRNATGLIVAAIAELEKEKK